MGQMAVSGDARQAGDGARRRRPLARIVLWTSALLVLTFTLGFGVFSTHVSAMMAPSALRGADAIVVLTGGQSRIDAAIDLLRSGKGKRLLISGVHPTAGLDDLRRATGAEEALFACCVDLDRAAVDTIGNAEESARWVQAHAYSSVILVTNNYHMPRSMLEMRRVGADVEILPYPVVNARLDRGEWITKPQALRVLFTEYTKYLAALARGFIDPSRPSAAAQPLDTAAMR